MDWLKAIVGIIAIIRAWLDRSQSAEDRAAGAAQANESTLRQGAERVAEARRAEAEPDSGEDDGFRRD